MGGLAGAALLAAVAVGCARGARALLRASWPRRSPAAAILLWQALGLAGGLAAVGALVGLGLPGRGSTSVARSVLHLGAAFRADGAGTWPVILSAIRLACLAAGLALLTLLCWVLVAASVAALHARRRQRVLLTLLAHG